MSGLAVLRRLDESFSISSLRFAEAMCYSETLPVLGTIQGSKVRKHVESPMEASFAG